MSWIEVLGPEDLRDTERDNSNTTRKVI